MKINKEMLDELTNLEKPFLVDRLAGKLAPHAKIIYIVLAVILALSALRSLVSVFTGNFSVAIFDLVMVAVYFVIVRMFCEFLVASAPKEAKVSVIKETK